MRHGIRKLDPACWIWINGVPLIKGKSVRPSFRIPLTFSVSVRVGASSALQDRPSPREWVVCGEQDPKSEVVNQRLEAASDTQSMMPQHMGLWKAISARF